MNTWSVAGLALLLTTVVYGANVTHRADQAPGSAEQVAKGKALYATCAACHGTEGEGKVGIAPRLNSASYLAVVSNDFLKRTIKEGRPGTNMIPWGHMPDADIDALVAYVRAWQTTDGVELDASPLSGAATDGEKLYTTICARCHGRSGAGYSESGSGTGIGRTGFLGQIDDGTLRALIQYGKDNTPMRPFDEKSPVSVADLTAADRDAIIQYLRANAW